VAAAALQSLNIAFVC